jgi:transposase
MLVLTNEQWAVLGPLIEACRPPEKVPPSNLRRTVSAILWRHSNGAKWRALPEEYGRCWMAAQTFVWWSRLGVWDRLLTLTQGRGVELGMAFLDGGYSSHAFREHIWNVGSRPAIPTRREDAPVACPEAIYNNRNRVERLWARLKEWRAVATRYEKTAVSFLGALSLAAALNRLGRCTAPRR